MGRASGLFTSCVQVRGLTLLAGHTSTGYGPQLPNRGNTIDALLKRGLHMGVCQVSTRGYAGAIAMAVGSTQDAIFAELKANLLPNARLVPAGIVAVNRAQERGYTLATVER